MVGQTQSITNDSLKLKKNLFKTNGNIGLGYDYGFIPFGQNITAPSGYFKAEGNIGWTIKNLPFQSTFFYTNLKNINGLNNYFRISFDFQAYQSYLTQKKNALKEKYAVKIPELQSNFQDLQKKIAYLNHVENNLDHYYQLPDSNAIQNPFQTTLPPLDSTLLPSTDSMLLASENRTHFSDSIRQKKENLIQQANEIETQIQTYKKLIQQFDLPLANSPLDTLIYKNKTEKFISQIQKFEVGMCYPAYSQFLVNNIPVKGLNFEYENAHHFFAFTAGSTINNLLFTNNIIQNNLQNTQNLFNFFDFNSPQQGRRIVSAKTGWGKKEGDHFFVGALYGNGQQSYYVDSLNPAPSNALKEHNWVLELDGKLKVKKWLDVNLIYGKSSVRPLNDESDTTNARFNQLFSNFRSNAALGKFLFSFEKIHTQVAISIRWIDPFFKSFGVGFIRADNFRYEIKTDHAFGKKWKAGLSYRKDENNLLNLFNYTTILHSGGIHAQYRVNKHLSLRGNFNPVYQISSENGSDILYKNQNYISNLSISHHAKHEKTNFTTNLIGSYYQLFNGETNIEYSNICLSNSIHRKNFSHQTAISLFMTNGMDSLSGGIFLVYDELTYTHAKYSVSGGIKYSKNENFGNQFGYSLKLIGRIHKNISLELRGEKLVLGDFYNSIGLDLYRSYPYIWSGKIILNW